jgi:hypothetical protein
MTNSDRDSLVAYLIDRVEDLVGKATVANAPVAKAAIAEAQELLAIRANIVRRRSAIADDTQLSLPLDRAA